MAPKVYTKNELLQELTLKGINISLSELDSYLEEEKIEAIFENESGREFFDETIFDMVLRNFSNNPQGQIYNEHKDEIEEIVSSDNEVQKFEIPAQTKEQTPSAPAVSEPVKQTNVPKRTGILEGALSLMGQHLDSLNENPDKENIQNQENQDADDDFDDMSLLSESFEAQQKFKEYVLSQMKKKNMEIDQGKGFTLDVSEKTINLIAKTLAKKIAQYVNSLISQDMITVEQYKGIQDKAHRMEKRLLESEEETRKLRLLLAEANRNLNSYKPSIFGLYKKVKIKNQKR